MAIREVDEHGVSTKVAETEWLFVTPELPVRDVRETQAYYRDVLGFRIAWLYEEEYGAVYNGKIYVTGGEYEYPAGKITFWAFEAYEPKTNTWQILPHMQIARHGFVAAFIDNDFHVAGGSFQSDGMPGILSQMATHEIFPVAK